MAAPEATKRDEGQYLDFTPVTAREGGDVLQTALGNVGIPPEDIAAAALGALEIMPGVYRLAKTASIVMLAGGRAYWDHSANAVHFKKVNDRDFYLGRVVADVAGSSATVDVKVNFDPCYDIDLARDPFTTAVILTAGTAALNPRGGGNELHFSATAEAQKVDMLSVDGFAVAANAIVEGAFRVINKGDAAALDFNIGIANATHATDGDAITESCFIHLDGAALSLYAESDDGTTEVAATDTTVDATEGAALTDRVEFWMDMRSPADIQIYLDGILMLPNSTFKLDAATGPLKLLAHLEKTSDDTPGDIAVDFFRARFAEE